MKLPTILLNQFKKNKRIYILPTKMGGYLNGLIFLMFLLSIGYNNNLLLIFTLILFALNLMWLIQTHYHLKGLDLLSIHVGEGHAEDDIPVKFIWKKSPDGPCDWKISLESYFLKKELTKIHVVNLQNKDHQKFSEGYLTFPSRGLWNFHLIKIGSSKPFGLYYTWTYKHFSCQTYIYPKISKNVSLPCMARSLLDGESTARLKGLHDVWNLAPYQGEESRKISWKHYARSGELMIKEGEELKKYFLPFSYQSKTLESDDELKTKEEQLSLISSQIILCEKNDIAYSLELPRKKLETSHGPQHLRSCMRELALC